MFAPTLPPPATIAYIRPTASPTGAALHERTTSVSVAIAVCVGQTVRRPRVP